ncbi:MAG: hypothetical protein ACKPKO_26280, partial [Candidatus Fonsibacter sp.]
LAITLSQTGLTLSLRIKVKLLAPSPTTQTALANQFMFPPAQTGLTCVSSRPPSPSSGSLEVGQNLIGVIYHYNNNHMKPDQWLHIATGRNPQVMTIYMFI